MAGKMTVKGRKEEALIEAQSLYSNHAEDIDKVIQKLHEQESRDKNNDITRNKVEGFLRAALESNTAGSKELTDRNLHAAFQLLNQQEQEDLNDDFPRQDALLLLSEMKFRTMANQRIIRSLQQKVKHE